MIKRLLIYLLFATILVSCKQEENNDDSAQVTALYHELCNTYAAYTDSLKSACDSASIEAATNGLDNALREIYARYPADLDTRLSQSQNDSLWFIASKYMKQRNKTSKPSLPADSLTTDSTQLEKKAN